MESLFEIQGSCSDNGDEGVKSHLCGSKLVGFFHTMLERPIANGMYTTLQPAGTNVPSGSVSSFTAHLILEGTEGYKRSDSLTTAVTYLQGIVTLFYL